MKKKNCIWVQAIDENVKNEKITVNIFESLQKTIAIKLFIMYNNNAIMFQKG